MIAVTIAEDTLVLLSGSYRIWLETTAAGVAKELTQAAKGYDEFYNAFATLSGTYSHKTEAEFVLNIKERVRELGADVFESVAQSFVDEAESFAIRNLNYIVGFDRFRFSARD